jgi:hypothetical protein
MTFISLTVYLKTKWINYTYPAIDIAIVSVGMVLKYESIGSPQLY